MIKVDELIKEARKNGDATRLGALQSIKVAFQNFTTAKNAKPLDDTAEIQILKKLVAQREESIQLYREAGRIDLAEPEEKERDIIKEFLPAEVTQAEIEEVIEKWKKENNIENKIPKKSMGIVIKYVKSILPMADGKITADIINKMLE